MEIRLAHRDEYKWQYDVKDATGREYFVQHNTKLGDWVIRTRVVSKATGSPYWRDVSNGRVLAAVQHFERVVR